MARARRRRRRGAELDLPAKANRVLSIIFTVLCLIFLRIWQLAVVQHDAMLESALRPQVKCVTERAERGTICDRFGLPLALNKVQYNASVCYAHIRSVPAIEWQLDANGKRQKIYRRRAYITELSQVLGQELGLPADRLEDLIYSKAALYQHVPYLLREDIHEESYYRLKMLEREWPGIVAERCPKRYYPHGRVASDVIGYMGAINRGEYEAVMAEVAELDAWLASVELGETPPFPASLESITEVEARLHDLRERAYGINDYLGKAGIEAQYEEELRGFQGRRYYEVDAQGRHLKELSGAREPLPGQSVQLSLSAELQEFAERLLIENEAIREGRSKKRDPRTGEVLPQKQPWIKGGAIVAMDPKTGELLALASYPRFDPNDFVACSDPYFQSQRRSSVNRWLETEQHLAELWDQRRPMQREATAADGSLYEEELWLTWENFIERILPIENPVRAQLQVQGTVAHALEAQEALDNLQAISQESSVLSLLNHLYTQADGHVAYKGKGLSRKRRFELEQNLEAASRQVAGYKETLDRFVGSLPHNYDKLLLLDLYKLAVDPTRFSEDLASLVGQQSLSSYRESGIAVTRLKEVLRGMMAQLFHESDFKCWRDAEQANFLREKRREERLAETYQKPYLDYLDKEERRQFQAFWATHAPQCIQMLLQGDTEGELSEPYRSHIQAWHQELLAGAHQQLPWVPAFHRLRQQVSGFGVDQLQAYLATVRTYSELDRSLYGWYPQLRREHGVQKEKHLAAAVYPTYGFGYCRSSAYSEGMALGSLFKLVTGYCALLEDYQRLMARGQEVRKLVPFTIVDSLHRGKDKESRWNVGFFNSGKPIPQHYKGGRLIRSASRQLGHVDFVTALERSSNPYFSLLAGDIMEDPEELARMAHAFSFGARTGLDLPNECAGRVPEDIGSNRSGLYAFAIGQHSFVATPLQAAVMLSACGNRGEIYRPLLVKRLSGVIPAQAQAAREIASLQPMLPFKGSPSAILEIEENFAPDLRRELWMPPEVLEPLWLGMYRSAQRTQTRNIYSLYRFYDTHLEGVKDLSALKGQLLGKSSTAEMLESIDLDRLTGRQTYNHLWYGGVIFPEPLSLEGDEHIFWNRQGDPELVVVVFLRFGGYGYEAAPIAAQIARKWREIRAAHL